MTHAMHPQRFFTMRSVLLLSVAMLLSTTLALASPRVQQAASSRWEVRLARLDPVRPMDYLDLGEEVADAATTEDERILARELFGLAGALDAARLGRSAMLALASVATDDAERARATAGAELVGGKGIERRDIAPEPAQLESLARAISYHRRGEGRKALNVLKQDNSDALLERVGEALAGGADVFRSECANMPTGGPPLSDESMVVQGMLVELALRSGDLRAPGVDLALYNDEPLIEIDLSDPQSTWRVDPARAWWRNGKWSGNS